MASHTLQTAQGKVTVSHDQIFVLLSESAEKKIVSENSVLTFYLTQYE